MFTKIVFVVACVAVASAIEYGHHAATSYATINHYDDHHGHHYAAAPVAAVIAHHAAPAYVHHAHHAAPVLVKSHHHYDDAHNDYAYAHPQYQFKYGVEDHHTGDIKSQEESRDGDVVKGSYSLVQPDGRTRTVHYSSDKHSGFQAHVEYSGHAGHPEVHYQKAAVAAVLPVVHKAVVAAAPVYKVPAYPHF